MNRPTETRIEPTEISIRRQAEARIAVVGTPNCGKSTLFNRLTGLRQRIGNYPGVTVERHTGTLILGDRHVELVDLPGTHGLSPHSYEERIAIDVILGRLEDADHPQAILAVVDATNLYQGLYLVQQLLELELPVAVALTMADAAEAQGLKVDVGRLSERLAGVPVYPVVATTGRGIDALKAALVELHSRPAPAHKAAWPELADAARELRAHASPEIRRVDAERLLIDGPNPSNAATISFTRSRC